MNGYGYDAPDYYDFTKGLTADEPREDVESYFEIEHEAHDIHRNGTYNHNTPTIDDSERDLDQDFFTPLKTSLVIDSEDDDDDNKCNANRGIAVPTSEMRRSLSMNDINRLPKQRQRWRLRPKKESLASSTTSLRTKSVAAEPYVSMAEAIRSFHLKTPRRFRSLAKNHNFNWKPKTTAFQPAAATIPQSPMLQTKRRARPLSAMTREERELEEFKEAQKFHVKAIPLNRKILSTPPIVQVSRKSPTVPEPFHLSENQPKKQCDQPQTYKFHAKPAPKVNHAPPIIKSMLVTEAKTPKFMKKYVPKTTANLKHETTTNGPVKPFKPEITKSAPFSFLERDKERVSKKEQLRNEILQEEKKAREFHAQPLPKYIFKSPKQNRSPALQKRDRAKSDGSGSVDLNEIGCNRSQKGSKSNLAAEVTVVPFKAQPAKVLQMKPFSLKKTEHPLTEIMQFQLNTEKRATQREEFEQHKKEREKIVAEAIHEYEITEKMREEEEVRRLRKEAVHKANPIRHYKEVKMVEPKELTRPLSPTFLKKHNKENSIY